MQNILFPTVAFAASTTINTNLPGTNPSSSVSGVIGNFYTFALLIAGILALGAIVWGGIKYATSAGNPSQQSEGKSWILNALLGLLLLAGAWIVLQTINPQLTGLTLPSLPGITIPSSTGGNASSSQQLTNCTPVGGNLGTCVNCSNSAGVTTVTSCLKKTSAGSAISATYNGQHTCYVDSSGQAHVSCHFGGQSCTDGSHAFDLGGNMLQAAGLTLQQGADAAQTCGSQTGNSVTCYCESGTNRLPSCSYPNTNNHVHCNVNNSACGCN